MKLYLVDTNDNLVDAWNKEFSQFSEVTVISGDILSYAKNTIVSPANSYGFMDGGIDRIYTNFFGLQPQTEIQKAITKRVEGYLPIGASVVVNTGNTKIPFMIAAPTMITPGSIPPSNCYFAMAAVLNAVNSNIELIEEVYCPGLGAGIGGLKEETVAEEMLAAYKKWRKTSCFS